jgi:hypothetical protein
VIGPNRLKVVIFQTFPQASSAENGEEGNIRTIRQSLEDSPCWSEAGIRAGSP